MWLLRNQRTETVSPRAHVVSGGLLLSLYTGHGPGLGGTWGRGFVMGHREEHSGVGHGKHHANELVRGSLWQLSVIHTETLAL